MSQSATDVEGMSPHCAVAQRPDYEDLHLECRRTEDIPLPHSAGIVLVPRCRCDCHPAPLAPIRH